MNKILTLYNIEFKRIYKLYFALIGALIVGNLGVLSYYLYITVLSLTDSTKFKDNINLLKSPEAKSKLFDYYISNMYVLTNILLGIAVLLCILYAFAIWYRDFLGKSKTAYTLFMLPNNKFSIYISKAITIVVMIYGVMATQILSWASGVMIIKSLTGIDMAQIKAILVRGVRVGGDLNLIQPFLVDFIMINVLGVILLVLVIFTGIMIEKSFKKKRKGIIAGFLYIVLSISFYLLLVMKADYADVFLMIHSIYYIVSFATSIVISYLLINKKIHI